MTTVNKILKITLKSDLCTGSGYAYAGIIDSDISYNQNGIPFISGRRLKGCMKEAAEMIGVTEINEIFGKRGNHKVQGIMIGNAYPEKFVKINEELSVIKKGTEESKYLNQQNILNLFTSVKAQTKIDENGVADDNTLRFTRVINQYDPIEKEEMVFAAELSYEYEGEKDGIKDDLERIVKATRNIGMNRNRGLGNVRLKLIDKKNNDNETNHTKKEQETVSKSNKKKITYCITNTMPLMMSGNKDNISECYINGASVLGVLAGAYLKHGKADDENFNRIFLEGKVNFSNLTLAKSINKEWVPYYPAPLYINRLKKTKKLVNIASKEFKQKINDEEYSPDGGNQPKKLKTQFVAYKDGKYFVDEVEKSIIYHHSTKGKSQNGEEGILYSLEVVEANQYFTGTIITDADLCDTIVKLLHNVSFRFGKSKSAQYGTCKLVENSIHVADYEPVRDTALSKGNHILVTLLSDGIFVNEHGMYTVQYDEVRKSIGTQLGIAIENENTHSFIQTKELTGYHTTWNLKKQAIPSIKAGSAIEFILQEDLKEYPEFIGEKNLEGFGQCRIVSLADAPYKLEEMEFPKQSFVITKASEELKQMLQKILVEQLYTKMKEKAFFFVDENRINISASALGRLTLMLVETENEERGNPEQIYKKLMQRIASIKSTDTQKEIKEFLKKTLGAYEKENLIEETVAKLKMDNLKNDKVIREYELLEQYFGTKEAVTETFNLWNRYLADILVYQKYAKK